MGRMKIAKAIVVLHVMMLAVISEPAWAGKETTGGAGKKKEGALLSPMVAIRDHRAQVVHLQKLRAKILENLTLSNDLDNVSIYVEDLNSGVWMGINEKKALDLGSLLKVGMAIAWLRWDQEHPGVLEKKVTVLPEDLDTNDVFSRAVDSPLVSGDYRVLYLIEKMIVYSDNTALRTLYRNIHRMWVDETFSEIGIPNPFSAAQEGKISAKQYAQMIKSLYNASYLDPSRSELLLRMLTRTKFTPGLRSVLPKETTAALKYGLWEGVALYESGIVYLRDNPYLVCIFTVLTEKKFDRNLKLIRDVGGTVEDFFEEIVEH